MSKKDERARIVEAVKSEDFEKECEKDGFTVCYVAEESKSKKKANI
jgi:hypothetical protein